MQKVKDFWIKSYRSDPVAFGFELTSFIFTVVASLILADTANKPNMLVVYPGFFIGSITGAYAYYRRGLAWPLVLTSYFAVVNIFGYGVASYWW
jgi:hypothetical protein